MQYVEVVYFLHMYWGSCDFIRLLIDTAEIIYIKAIYQNRCQLIDNWGTFTNMD